MSIKGIYHEEKQKADKCFFPKAPPYPVEHFL